MAATTVTLGNSLTGVLLKPHYVAAAVVLNILLLGAVGWWCWQQLRGAPQWQRRVLAWALGGRLFVAGLSGLHPSPDVSGFRSYSWAMTRQLWAFPLDWVHTMVSNEFRFADWQMVYHGMSNTFFFLKLLSVVNLFTLGNDSATAAYLSLFAFIGCWQLVRTLARLWPASQPGAWAAFLLWPSVAFWTSAYTKESVLLGSGAWLLALVLAALYGPAARSFWWRMGQVVAIGLLAALHFNMRFFYAAPLLGGLVALGVAQALARAGVGRGRLGQAAVVLAVLAAGAWLVPQVSPAFRLNKFTNQMVQVYAHHLAASQGRPHFEYPDLVPTAESALRHLPSALVNAVVRPLPGESKEPKYVAAGLENLVLLLLVGLLLVAWRRGRSLGPLPFALVLVLGLYCVAVALLLGLTTPNLGTLNRYRSAMLPFLLLLLLQNEYAAALLRRLGLGRAEKLGATPP